MSEIAIKVKKLSKQYRIGIKEDVEDTFVGAVGSVLQNPFKNFKKLTRLTNFKDDNSNHEDIIWALSDVSFEVKKGDILGVIGPNGAGKSTLLKILSKITHPSSGRVELKGRVASLLEVGTGFHPELTGRENIYLNGTILGMTKREIDRKLDEIINFSGVEKFLDTPVKRYSSGMRVRLAFSVAAHLDPEILLIDEVLAVGDYSFQKKCLGKMDEVSKSGKTVLFVSHQLSMIKTLCNRSILLDNGKIILEGSVDEVIQKYVKSSEDLINDSLSKRELIKNSKNDKFFQVIDFEILQDNFKSAIFINSESLTIKIHYKILNEMENFRLNVDMLDTYQSLIFQSFHDDMNEEPTKVSKGEYISRVDIPKYFLAPKVYYLRINASIHNDRMLVKDGIIFPLKIERSGLYNKAYPGDPIRGIIAPALHWETIRL